MDISQKLTEWLESLSGIITHFPKTTLVVILLVTLFFGFWIPSLEIDNSVGGMLPSSHPAQELYDEVTETFGGTDTVIVAYRSEDIFSVEELSRINELTKKFTQVEGVDDVQSIANSNELEGSGGTLKVSDLVPDSGVNPEDVPKIEDYVKNTQTLRGTVLSEEGKYAGFLLELAEDASDSAVYSDLNEIIEKEKDSESFSLAGGPAVNAEMTSSMKSDLVTLIPFVILVLALVLYLSLRTTGGVFISLAVVVLSTIWTVGLMALTGTEMAMISTTLPVILIAIGIADSIHILNDYYHRLGEGKSIKEAVDSVVIHIGMAIVLTSITDSVGFGSLSASPVSQVMEFGMFVAFGAMAALTISLTLIPALITLTNHGQDKRDTSQEEGTEDPGSEILASLGKFVVDHKTATLVIGVLILGVAVYGTTLITVETNTLRFFRPESEIRESTAVIDNSFGGSENLSVVVNGDIKDPAVLNGMLELQEQFEDIEQIGYSMSIANLVREINRALSDEFKIPNTRNAVAQELLLYEMSGDPSDLEAFVNYDYDKAKISVRMSSVSSSELGKVVEKAEEKAKEIAGDKFDVQVTGSSYLFKVLTDLLVRGQITSLAIALFAVAVLIGFFFLSARYGLMSTIPLGFTIAVNFGLMGLLGIPLDSATTMLASIAIGTGVDYTIHFISRYRQGLEEGESPENAVINSTRTTGQAISYNVIAVAAGFGVLIASSFTPYCNAWCAGCFNHDFIRRFCSDSSACGFVVDGDS